MPMRMKVSFLSLEGQKIALQAIGTLQHFPNFHYFFFCNKPHYPCNWMPPFSFTVTKTILYQFIRTVEPHEGTKASAIKIK